MQDKKQTLADKAREKTAAAQQRIVEEQLSTNNLLNGYGWSRTIHLLFIREAFYR